MRVDVKTAATNKGMVRVYGEMRQADIFRVSPGKMLAEVRLDA